MFKKRVQNKYNIIAMKIGNFSIPDKIKSNYKIQGDLSNIKNWKAKVILANSANEDNTGSWDDIGYVAFKPSTGTIVPIARSDEHHQGYDLVRHLMETGLVPKGTYYFIWCLSGPNYLYAQHIKEILPVYKKWLERGGTNLQVSIRSDKGDKYISFQDVVDGKAGVAHPKGTLHTYGKELIEILEKLAKFYAASTGKARPKLKELSTELLKLSKFIHTHRLSPIPHEITEEKIEKAAHDVLSDKDLDKVMEIIFGFHGLKNKMHTNLKEAVNKSDSWDARDLKEFFGDVDFALEEFNRISSI